METRTIDLAVTPAIKEFLTQLTDSGFYGRSDEETAAVLLQKKLREYSPIPVAPNIPKSVLEEPITSNWSEPELVAFGFPPVVGKILHLLTETGFYGKTALETARDLVKEKLRELLSSDSPVLTDEHVATKEVLYACDELGTQLSELKEECIPRIASASDAVINHLRKHPDDIFSLSPRGFEELVAELLERQGWSVKLTPQSKDGGKDIIAVMPSSLGRHLCLVETKQYRIDRPVGVNFLRHLYGVVQSEEANSGCLITSSFFSGEAVTWAARHSNLITVRDLADIRKWIASNVHPG